MSDNRSNEFAVGIFAKPPHENAPDFVKMGLALNAWAATKRKKNRAKAKLAKASRKRNRVAR